MLRKYFPKKTKTIISCSFRDPSGFVFKENGHLYRKINPCYFSIYNDLKDKKIFDLLWDERLIVHHQEVKRQELLLNRKDVFTDYAIEKFKEQFSKYFSIEESIPVKDSLRVIYLMKVKQ